MQEETPKSTIKQVLQLLSTERCNLACVYCYERDKDNSAVMPVSIAKAAIEKAFQDKSHSELEIHFHGGEPFSVFREIREVAEWVWANKWPKPYIFFATTNGTLVHGEIKDWVIANHHRFMLSLSLDGTREMHNLNRSSSFDRIDLALFRRYYSHQPIKMTISRLTLPMLAEGIIYLHKLGFKMTSNHAYGAGWLSEDVDTFATQLRILCDFYLDNPSIEPCNIVMPMIEYASPAAEPRKWCGTGVHMSCVDTTGRTFPCQMFMETAYAASPEVAGHVDRALESSTLLDETCAACTLSPICPTCYGMNYMENGSLEKRNSIHCEFTKVRSKASAYLLSEMIVNRDRSYKHLEGKPGAEMYRIVQAIGRITDPAILAV